MLTPLDIASTTLAGFDPSSRALPAVTLSDPAVAFRDTIREALLAPPCLVSFSGGRDSSTVLAVAVDVARKEGLPLPVPATMYFPGDTNSIENSWQTMVLDHLRVTDRIVYELTDEMDIIGEDAASVLSKHGVLFPMNVHFHCRIFRDAAGGTVLTGIGGDEVANAAIFRWTESALSEGRISAKTIRSLAYHLSPRAARLALDLARTSSADVKLPWLNRRAVRELRIASAKDRAAEPLGWGRALREVIPRHRYFTEVRRAYQAVAEDHDVAVVHPFVAPATLQALASRNPFEGIGGRQALVRMLSDHTLPTQLVERRTKAEFGQSFWTDNTRKFARSWNGEGLGEVDRYVDADGLRAEWSKDIPDARSMMLLQHIWLNGNRR